LFDVAFRVVAFIEHQHDLLTGDPQLLEALDQQLQEARKDFGIVFISRIDFVEEGDVFLANGETQTDQVLVRPMLLAVPILPENECFCRVFQVE